MIARRGVGAAARRSGPTAAGPSSTAWRERRLRDRAARSSPCTRPAGWRPTTRRTAAGWRSCCETQRRGRVVAGEVAEQAVPAVLRERLPAREGPVHLGRPPAAGRPRPWRCACEAKRWTRSGRGNNSPNARRRRIARPYNTLKSLRGAAPMRRFASHDRLRRPRRARVGSSPSRRSSLPATTSSSTASRRSPRRCAESVGRYTEFRSAGLARLAPDPARDAHRAPASARPTQVHRVKFPGGARTQLTFFPDRVSGGVVPADAGRVLRLQQGTSAATSASRSIATTSPPATSRCSPTASRATPAASGRTAGDRIAYTSTRRNGARHRPLRHRPRPTRRPTSCSLEVKGGGWWPARLVAGRRASSWSASTSRSTRATSGSSTSKTGDEDAHSRRKGRPEKVAYGGGQFAKDGKGIYTTTDKDSEFRRLARIDLATEASTPS